jgi:hypothetical protein
MLKSWLGRHSADEPMAVRDDERDGRCDDVSSERCNGASDCAKLSREH